MSFNLGTFDKSRESSTSNYLTSKCLMNKLIINFWQSLKTCSKQVKDAVRCAFGDNEVTQQDVHTGTAGFPGGGWEGLGGSGTGQQAGGSVWGRRRQGWARQGQALCVDLSCWLSKSQAYITKHVLEIISRGHSSLWWQLVSGFPVQMPALWWHSEVYFTAHHLISYWIVRTALLPLGQSTWVQEQNNLFIPSSLIPTDCAVRTSLPPPCPRFVEMKCFGPSLGNGF